jgi:hypothetical protein
MYLSFIYSFVLHSEQYGGPAVWRRDKMGGGVQYFIFPSDDLFLNKNKEFCWEIAKIFKSWGVRTLRALWSPHPCT